MEVICLVDIAYAEIRYSQRREMVVEVFANMLEHPMSLRHPLVLRSLDMEGAVHAGNGYFQIQNSHQLPRPKVAPVFKGSELVEAPQIITPG